MPLRLLAVFVGGSAGGLARWAVTRGVGDVPWATAAVNVSGAFALALLLVVLLARSAPVWVRPLLGTGFLGAWTTFSGIVVPADELARAGRLGPASSYVLVSVVGGALAAYGGLVLGRRLTA